MAFEVLERDGYVEFRMFGAIDGSNPPPGDLGARFVEVGRVLVDTTEVESLSADVMWMAAYVAQSFRFGSFRVAVVAGNDVVFGTLRQVAAYLGTIAEGAAIEFFRDRATALAWLLKYCF